MEEGLYSQAVEEYGKAIELLFKELYTEYLPQLSYPEKESVINFEKNLKKSVSKFTIGEWIGLFREASLFSIIRNRKRIERRCVFFTLAVIDAVNELRNRSTHPSEGLKDYDMANVATFVESAVLCMLQELGMVPKKEAEYAGAIAEVRIRLGKQFARVSREDVLRAARNPRIENFFWVSKYVEIEGKRYPVKGLLSLASGVSTSKFTTNRASRILENLGFNVKSITK